MMSVVSTQRRIVLDEHLCISLQMKRLQEELGVPLFRKHGRALKLTRTEQTALGLRSRMLALNDDLLQTMQGVTLAGIHPHRCSAGFSRRCCLTPWRQLRRSIPERR